ncbi:immunoglobulin I-set domain protein [Opisthorchis viverrini]|uniref:Immunoglobulin I-set domain protein n=1 Tax=Opisthorchis viverrini TaxID=6198 RepID=A0A1S8WVP8_OPIVI|nr:immunoglobulin I-set domain protein [Opisthorchis viverrini]
MIGAFRELAYMSLAVSRKFDTMATQDFGGVVNYQTYTPQPMSTSTKVLTLSHPQSPAPSPGQQNYYAQPAGQQQYASPFQPVSPQSYQTVPRFQPGQPQVFTVGSNQGQQPQQNYRVITSPGQQATQPNAIYFGQPQQQQIPQYASYQSPQQPQSYQPVQPLQTWQPAAQQQLYQSPQPAGQVMFAQPAARPAQQTNAPPSAVSYQTQTSIRDGQHGSSVTMYPTANQQPVTGQPISMQSSQQHQQWAAPAQSAPAQVYPPQQHQQPRVYSAVPAGQTQPPPPQQTQFGQQPSRAQQVSSVQLQQTPGGYQAQQQYQQPSNQFVPQSDQVTVSPQQQQQAYQARPPASPGQFGSQQLHKRTPSVGGPTRNIKVKSLPMRNSASIDGLDSTGPPQFVQHPVGQINVSEGEQTNVTARVRPAGDSSLRVEWYKNGKPLSASSRFNTIFDRGYAVLEFLYTNEDDTGDYSCVATNDSGQDQSSSCHINVIPEENVITDSQLPDESMIANLAAMENQMMQNGLARGTRYRDEPKSTRLPQFVKPLNPQTGLRESAPAHFETIIEPANDSSLEVEWYKDGKPVSMGCRFNAILDRGFAVLDILYCYPEDNGAYWCMAKNSLGQVQSNVVELQCSPEASIVTNSVLSKESVSYLQSLDNWGSEQMSGYDRPPIEDEEPPSAPSFDILPVALTVTEGNPARFLVKAGGFPRPRVQWYLDGELLASTGGGGNWRVYQDGGISHLEFHRVGSPCTQKVLAVARNNLGEASAETVLVIEPQIDFRPDLRHVEPENPFKKLAQLKKVERTSELNSAFNRPRPQALDLRRIERQAEYNARAAAENEALEAENLYARVQSQLRTSRRSSQPPPTPPPTRQAPATNAPPPQQHQRALAPEPQPKKQTYQAMSPGYEAKTELMHDEISADFTIEL